MFRRARARTSVSQREAHAVEGTIPHMAQSAMAYGEPMTVDVLSYVLAGVL